jgi:hypothetical protein
MEMRRKTKNKKQKMERGRENKGKLGGVVNAIDC